MGDEKQPPTPAKRIGMAIAKLLLLGLAVFVVSRQVSLDDSIVTSSGEEVVGTISGEGLQPDAKDIVMKVDGKERTFAAGEWDADSKKLGIRSAFSKLSLGYYALGMLFIFGMYIVGVIRWRMLLHAQEIKASFWDAFRLTFMGFFWNNFMPGMTGGDVAKAVLVARDAPDRRAAAVSTVIVDRLIGLAVLALMSALAILSNFAAFRDQGYLVLAVLAGCIVGFVCVLSRRVRSRLGVDNLLKKLPMSDVLMKLDSAFQYYRSRPKIVVWSVVLSVFVHFFNIGHVYIFGQDLGIEAHWMTYLATVPIIFIVAAVPIFPGGWGVREAGFVYGFAAAGVGGESASLLVLLSVLVGFSAMVYSLVGGVFLFIGRRKGEVLEDIEAPQPA